MSKFSKEDDNKILFHRPIKINNFETYSKNQDVDLDYTNSIVTVTSNQDISTPGIFITRNILVPRNTFYEFVVKGRALNGATPFLFGDQNNNRNIRITAYNSESTKYLTNSWSSVSVVIGGFNVQTSIRLGIMLKNPDINHKFQISGIAIIRKNSLQLGDFRLYEMPQHLVIDSKTQDTEWKFVAAFTKRK